MFLQIISKDIIFIAFKFHFHFQFLIFWAFDVRNMNFPTFNSVLWFLFFKKWLNRAVQLFSLRFIFCSSYITCLSNLKHTNKLFILSYIFFILFLVILERWIIIWFLVINSSLVDFARIKLNILRHIIVFDVKINLFLFLSLIWFWI